MMNLIARTPSFVSSSTSVSPGKKYYGNQDPWKSVVGDDRPGQPGREKAKMYDLTGKPVDSLKARTQQATQNGTMTKLGLLKSGNLMN